MNDLFLPSLDNVDDVTSPRSSPNGALFWPNLEQLGLGADERKTRARGIGGSDANIILSGNSEYIRALWAEKRGEREPEDLSDRFQVMLGNWTEQFNRQWYEKVTGVSVTRSGASMLCPKFNWRRCTLDGYIENPTSVWEAKHTSAFAKPEEVLQRYMPQLQHNMAVSGCDRAVLSVIFGNQKYEIFEVAADWLYQLDLLQAEEDFWECVLNGNDPVAVLPPPPPKPIGVREVCLEGNNFWATAAADWIENRVAAKTHAEACSAIKGMVDSDVARAFGHSIEAKRSKSGAISIRELAK